jgi:hypothetical protein
MNFVSFFFAINLEMTNINRKLFILQYNVHKFKNVMMTSFLRDSTIKKFDIIVVQKSWINAYANIIHHFLKNNHFLFYLDQIEMKKNLVRICIFVIKRIFIEDLKYLFRSKDVIIVQIRLHESHYSYLHNVYNESNILSFFCFTESAFRSEIVVEWINQKSHHNERFQHSSFIMKKCYNKIEQQIIRNVVIDEWISITI